MVGAAVAGAAVVGGIATAYSGQQAADATAEASKDATKRSVAEQRYEFDVVKEILSPYVESGVKALGSQEDLLGLNGPDKQRAAIAGLEASPEFAALTQQGETSILQNASATGGLRGGNTAAALAQYRPALLSQMINDRFAKLGDITQLGQASAAGTGSAAINAGNAISNAYMLNGQTIGNANAGAALAKGQAVTNVTDSVATYALLSKLKAF